MRLYVHWPFCVSRCSYCDFNTRVASRGRMLLYGASLLRELAMWAEILGEEETSLLSVYLGGGTPSTMSGREVAAFLQVVGRRFALDECAEVTVEVNPATWNAGDFYAAVSGGVNRFSIGVQSLDDSHLRLLGRAHSAVEAEKAVKDALRCGASVSVDLMLGLPAMDTAQPESGIGRMLELGVHHLSLYALTLSGASPLAREVESGAVTLPDEDETADRYLAACGRLRGAGYEHYEISNFCLPGHHSRHNSAYWDRGQYLGLGAGSHSLLGRCRLRNTASVLSYSRIIDRGGLAVDACEIVDAEEELRETVMLGLRTSRGVPEEILARKKYRLGQLERVGLLRREEGRVRLTPEGMLVSNELIVSLY